MIHVLISHYELSDFLFQDLKDIDKQIAEVDKELNVYLKELGLEEL